MHGWRLAFWLRNGVLSMCWNCVFRLFFTKRNTKLNTKLFIQYMELRTFQKLKFYLMNAVHILCVFKHQLKLTSNAFVDPTLWISFDQKLCSEILRLNTHTHTKCEHHLSFCFIWHLIFNMMSAQAVIRLWHDRSFFGNSLCETQLKNQRKSTRR